MAAENFQGRNMDEMDYIIFWVDKTIGDPNEYQHLKKAFRSNTDPNYETWTMLNDKDFDLLLLNHEPTVVSFEGSECLLQCFTEVEDCLAAIDRFQNKRIFFISSGSLGKDLLPEIVARHPNVLRDPQTNEPYTSFYIFCHNTGYLHEWADDYINYIAAFDFDADLLERLVHDISEHLIKTGQQMSESRYYLGALQYFERAKKLRHRYDTIKQNKTTDSDQPVDISRRMEEIDRLIEETTRLMMA